MSTVIDTGLSLAAIRGEFFQAFDGVKTFFQDLCMRIPGSSKTEDFRFLGQVPQMRAFGDGRVAQGISDYRYSVDVGKYESTIEVDRDEKSDDQLGQINMRIAEMAQAAAVHKDVLLASLLENGGTSGYNGYDGVTFFNDAHEIGNSGAIDNNLSLNVTTPADPTTSELKTAIQQMMAQLTAFKDDQGRPVNAAMTGLKLLVPPNMLFAAREAVGANLVVNTSNVLAGMAEVMNFPYLSSAEKLYLLKTDTAVRPFAFIDREPIEFTSLEQNAETGFMKEKYYYGVRARYTLAYADFTRIVRMTLT